MNQRQMGDEGWVLDVEVVLGDLLGSQLSFVGDGFGGEGIDVEAAFGTEYRGGFFFGHFANAEEFPFEISERIFPGALVGNKELMGETNISDELQQSHLSYVVQKIYVFCFWGWK